MQESTGRDRPVNAFTEERHEQSGFLAGSGEAVGITAAIAFQQAMGSQLAQIITQLTQGISFGIQLKAGTDGRKQLPRGPGRQTVTLTQKDFQEALGPFVFKFDSGDFAFAQSYGTGQTAEEVEFAVNIKRLGLEVGITGRNDLKLIADGLQIGQTLFKPKILEIVGDQFITQEG